MFILCRSSEVNTTIFGAVSAADLLTVHQPDENSLVFTIASTPGSEQIVDRQSAAGQRYYKPDICVFEQLLFFCRDLVC